MADAQLEDDLDFIRSFCPIFTPCDAQYDERKHKYTKVPSVRSWNTLTAERSAQLVDGRRDVQYLMFVTGEPTGLFVLDHDRLHPHRPDHVGCIDGVEAAQRWIGPIDTPDTFTTRSIGGGYHKVFQAHPTNSPRYLKNGPLGQGPMHCIEVLGNNRGILCLAKGCKIVQRIQPQPTTEQPCARSIINNYFQVNIGTVQNIGTVNIAPGTLSRPPTVSARPCTCEVPWSITQRGRTRLFMPWCPPPASVACSHRGAAHPIKATAASTCIAPCRRAQLLQPRKTPAARRHQQTPACPVLRRSKEPANGRHHQPSSTTLLAAATEQHLARDQGMVLKRIRPRYPGLRHRSQTYDAFLTQPSRQSPATQGLPTPLQRPDGLHGTRR